MPHSSEGPEPRCPSWGVQGQVAVQTLLGHQNHCCWVRAGALPSVGSAQDGVLLSQHDPQLAGALYTPPPLPSSPFSSLLTALPSLPVLPAVSSYHCPVAMD